MKFPQFFKRQSLLVEEDVTEEEEEDEAYNIIENEADDVRYTPRYFGLNGRIEPVTILFAIAKEQFRKNKIPDEDWNDVKSDILSERIPILDLSLVDINGTVYVESLNIFHRVADFLNLKGDNGDDKMISFQVIESMNETFNEVGIICFDKSLDSDRKQELYNAYMQEDTTQGYFKYMANLLKANSFFIGDTITAADVYYACVMGFVTYACPHVLDSFPALKEHIETVNTLDAVKACSAKMNKTV